MKIILSSNSPRRRQLLAGLDIDFEVRVLPDIDESFPQSLTPEQVPQYVAMKKAEAYVASLADDELVITADTVVVLGDEILGKPADEEEACDMLRRLGGCTHSVITGVCLTTLTTQRRFAVTSYVTFKKLSEEEILYYVDKYHPYDKAGAYGIQEWIGYIGVTGLEGSFFNVMGLPVQRIYQELQDMVPDIFLQK